MSKWSRIRRLVAQNVCPMGKPAKASLERIVYNLGAKRETVTAHAPTELRNDCQPRNAIILTLQTICLERNGSALERRVENE